MYISTSVKEMTKTEKTRTAVVVMVLLTMSVDNHGVMKMLTMFGKFIVWWYCWRCLWTIMG